jgi:hypothetical protein
MKNFLRMLKISSQHKHSILKMKKILIISTVAFFTLTAAVVADIYSSLDISKEQAKERLLECIGEGYIVSGEHDLVSKAKSLPVDMRVAGIRQLISLAKEYTSSEEFKSDYKKWRNNRLNPGQKTKLGIPRFRRMLDNAVDNAIDKKDNDNRYPADPQELIKKRLEEFLEVSGTVDFDAEMRGSMFANPKYEGKDDKWKMCYRAGREVVGAAREEAKKWLEEVK